MHVLVVEDNRTNLLVLKGIGSVAETIKWGSVRRSRSV